VKERTAAGGVGLASCPSDGHNLVVEQGMEEVRLADAQDTSHCKPVEPGYETESDIGPSASRMRFGQRTVPALEPLALPVQLFVC
jgi:hypothetical protein